MNCLVVVLIMIWLMTAAPASVKADFGLAFCTLPTVGDPFLMNLWFLSRDIPRRQENNMRFHVDTYSTPEFSLQLGWVGNGVAKKFSPNYFFAALL